MLWETEFQILQMSLVRTEALQVLLGDRRRLNFLDFPLILPNRLLLPLAQVGQCLYLLLQLLDVLEHVPAFVREVK